MTNSIKATRQTVQLGDRAAFEEWEATASNKDRYRVVEIPEGVAK